MKKLELGNVSHPELYSSPGKDCLVQNSVEALDFFRDFYTPHGIVVLGKATFTAVPEVSILVWIYVDVKKEDVLSLLPIFISDYEYVKDLNILSLNFFENEIFFFKDDELHSSLFTSTGQTELLKVRTLPILNEFAEALQLEGRYEVTDIYPVKVYNTLDNKFLATCWAFTTDSNELYFKPVCIEDNARFDNVDISRTEVFPIDLGETAEIGGRTYVLRYKKEWNCYFDPLFNAENKTHKAKKKANKPHQAVVINMTSAKK